MSYKTPTIFHKYWSDVTRYDPRWRINIRRNTTSCGRNLTLCDLLMHSSWCHDFINWVGRTSFRTWQNVLPSGGITAIWWWINHLGVYKRPVAYKRPTLYSKSQKWRYHVWTGDSSNMLGNPLAKSFELILLVLSLGGIIGDLVVYKRPAKISAQNKRPE